MAVDYDLVILGGGSAARSAAIAASRLKARVALIEPEADSAQLTYYFHHSLLQAGRVANQIRQAERFGLHPGLEPAIDLQDLRQRADALAQMQTEARSLSVLEALGVDVIVGQGEFFRRPHLGVAVKGRELRSRTYLIATGSRSTLPEIDGLQAASQGTAARIGYLTLEALARSTITTLPDHLVILGGEPSSIELAQTFARLGSRVTLIVRTRRLLPLEDAEAAFLIQAHLEAEGMGVLTETSVSQVKEIEGQQWLQAGNQAFTADGILVAIGRQPQLESLNLEAAGVKWHSWGIPVNARLQTTNPRIYACGEALGGYSLPHLAEAEAEIALKNALFYPIAKIDYSKIPWAMLTQPELARVGLTEAQAKQHYGNDVLVLRQFCKTLTQAQLQGESTGFCKLIVRRNGQILGAHLVGAEASEIIGAIALALQQNLSIQSLAQMGAIAPTWSEILQQTAAQWQHLRRSSLQADLLEGWFNLRRSGW
jgi:pyruvate/2-oxoglutarate dehydrogenase complex dihydrolipoamide dehydrogenase (E3) component